MSGEVASGAAKGAAAGAAFGPWGAVIGGVIGAIGGLFAKKSNAAKKRAQAEEIAIAERQAGIQRRDMVRQYRAARAEALVTGSSESGGDQSSAVLGGIASLGAQSRFNLQFFDKQVAGQRYVNKQLKKADKYNDYANTVFTTLSAASSIGGSGMFGGSQQPQGASKTAGQVTSAYGTQSLQQTNFQLGMYQVQNQQNLQSNVRMPILGY